jgi:hypothetical protein
VMLSLVIKSQFSVDMTLASRTGSKTSGCKSSETTLVQINVK